MNLNENGNKKDPETALWDKMGPGNRRKRDYSGGSLSILVKRLARCDQDRLRARGDTRTTPPLPMRSRQDFLQPGDEVIDCGILPTPALQYIVKEHYDGGAMITASPTPGV